MIFIPVVSFVSVSIAFLFFCPFFIAIVDLVGKELRKAGADGGYLWRYLDEPCRKYTQLDRNDNLFLTGDAKCNDKICFNRTVRAKSQISTHVVRGQSGFTGRVAELRKPGQESGIVCRGDA